MTPRARACSAGQNCDDTQPVMARLDLEMITDVVRATTFLGVAIHYGESTVFYDETPKDSLESRVRDAVNALRWPSLPEAGDGTMKRDDPGAVLIGKDPCHLGAEEEDLS